MAKTQTILLLTPATLARVDLQSAGRGGKSPRVADVWVKPRQESHSIAALVEAAYGLGGKSRGDVYVLSTSFWTGPVSLAREIIAGLSDEDITQSIALEAESFSGVPAFESQIAHSPIAPDAIGNSRWWVTQLDSGELAQIEEAVRGLGARLVGVGHPAVVPLSPPDDATTAWRSVQWWGEQTLLARGRGGAISDLQILSAGRQSQRGRRELDEFLADGPVNESEAREFDSRVTSSDQSAVDATATENGNQRLDASSSRLEWIDETTPDELLIGLAEFSEFDTTCVNQQEGLARWASAWLASRNGDAVPCPVVTLPKPPMSKEASIAISVAAGLAAIALCFVHHSFIAGQISDLSQDVGAMNAEVERVDTDRKRLESLQKKVKEVREAVEENRSANSELASRLDRAETLTQRQQDRWVALVDALSRSGDPESWIREVAGEDGSAIVRGFATDNAAVHRFATRLEEQIGGNGWRVEPAQTVTDPSRLVAFSVAVAYEGQAMPTATVATSDVPIKSRTRVPVIRPETLKATVPTLPTKKTVPVTSAPSNSVASVNDKPEQ